MKYFRRLMLLFLCVCLMLSQLPTALATQAEKEAEDISGKKLVTSSPGISEIYSLFDRDHSSYRTTGKEASLTLEHEAGIGSLYLIFYRQYGTYTITDNATGVSHTFGQEGYIHAWLDIEGTFGTCPTSLTLELTSGSARLAELYVYTSGRVPDFVQKWEQPREGRTDLVLFATHSDDDQMFFAGLLPYYALERGYQVLVVYLTTHFNTASFRVHEMLDGLWAVGVKAYPVLSPFPDFGTALNKEEAFKTFAEWGWSREYMTGYMVEQLRRFKPLVAVSHDLNGEYGHAQHKAYAQLVTDAVGLSQDPEAYPESAEKYGVWDVPKTYVHLYPENGIVMDFDQPMECFGGMTPYQVSKELGFACHRSQHHGWSWYLDSSDTAAGLQYFSPCQYGLFRTSVGPDVEKRDMFENLLSYGEQERLAAEEEARRLEAERLAAEAEAKRQEEERLAAEAEAKRQEEEKRLAAEAEAKRQAEERRNKTITVICAAVTVIALAVWMLRRKKK